MQRVPCRAAFIAWWMLTLCWNVFAKPRTWPAWWQSRMLLPHLSGVALDLSFFSTAVVCDGCSECWVVCDTLCGLWWMFRVLSGVWYSVWSVMDVQSVEWHVILCVVCDGCSECWVACDTQCGLWWMFRVLSGLWYSVWFVMGVEWPMLHCVVCDGCWKCWVASVTLCGLWWMLKTLSGQCYIVRSVMTVQSAECYVACIIVHVTFFLITICLTSATLIFKQP